MSSGSRRPAVIAAFTSLALVFSSGCRTPEQEPNPAQSASPQLPAPIFTNWPPQANEFRFHWSAAPGIDLETEPAVAVRAYMESDRLAAFAGGDPSVVYPGFMQSTPESTGALQDPDSLLQLRWVRPKTRAEYEANGLKVVARQVYGYQPTHILNMEPVDGTTRATVCVGLYSVYRTTDDDPGKFFSTIANETTGERYQGERSNVAVWRVELVDRAPDTDRPTVSGIPQTGPLPAPLDDVFGPWFVSGASAGYWGPLSQAEDVDTPEVRAQCEAAMPDDAATRNALATGFHDSPPPHGDPVPGWPDRVS